MTIQAQDIILTKSIFAPPSRVYAAFTTAAGWRAWCCETAEADAVIGGKLHIYTEGYNAYGEYQVLEPGKAVAFTWGGDHEPPVRISVSLQEDRNGTQLTFTVTGPGRGEEWTSLVGFLQRTWSRVLDNLKAVMEGGAAL